MLPEPPKLTKESVGTVSEEGICLNTEQCGDALSCMSVFNKEKADLHICVKDSVCIGNWNKWTEVGTVVSTAETAKYLFRQNKCMNKISFFDTPTTTTGTTTTTDKKRDDVPSTVNLKPAVVKKAAITATSGKVAKVVLKKKGEDCLSTNECKFGLGCLWVVDKRGD
jgi:hypothetical protein